MPRKAPYQVIFSHGFYLGKYEVTQEQWERLMGANPSYSKKAGRDAPVEQVHWNECLAFCRKAGNGLRLPTEAEWEYACRAGTAGPYYAGTGHLDCKGWYHENSYGKSHPVGMLIPNAWGLYDMHGNVDEFCSDWYGVYPKPAAMDPTGPSSGKYHVFRGGNYFSRAAECRAAIRVGAGGDYDNPTLGFRVALSAIHASP